MAPFFQPDFNKSAAQRTGTGVDAPVDEAGRTLLHVSVENGDTVAVARLLRQGANPRQLDGNGQSPLYAAITAHNTELIELLVGKGASFRDADDDGNTPLMWAIEMKSDVAFVQKLQELGATLDFQGESGRGALQAAAAANNTDVLSWLLKNRTPIDGADAKGLTALHSATANKSHEAMQMLIDNGADPLLRTKELKTALYYAAEKGDVAAADLLLALPDVRRTLNDFHTIADGFTPLMAAAAAFTGNKEGHLAVAAKLLDQGAYINDRDHKNRHSLFLAAELGTPEMVKLLIARGADVEKAPLYTDNNMKLTMVHKIGAAGYKEKLLLLVEAGVDINAPNNYGTVPLLDATEMRDAAKVRALLELGANPNLANPYGRRPLDRAVEIASWYNEDAFAVVAALLTGRADPNISPTETMQYAPLHIAARSSQSRVVKMLLDSGAVADVPDRFAGQTPWLAAVAAGNADACELLRQKGADTTVKDKNGRSVLHHAAQSGATAILQAGLADPAFAGQVDAPDSNGATPLQLATNSYRTDCVGALLGAGADPLAYDTAGMTALHYLVRCSNDQMYVLFDKALAKNKNAWNAQTRGDLQTPLHLAAKDGYTSGIEYMMKRDVDVTIRDSRGHTPLMTAVVSERSWAVRILAQEMKKKGLSIDAALDNNGLAPLHLAVSASYSAQVSTQALLDVGADINLRTTAGETALHIAAARGNIQLVQLLISRGAELTPANNAGMTALDIASVQGRQDIVTTLQNALIERQIKRLFGNRPANQNPRPRPPGP